MAILEDHERSRILARVCFGHIEPAPTFRVGKDLGLIEIKRREVTSLHARSTLR